MNVGSYIFSQVVDYIPRYQFDKLVAKYHGNWHSKDLTCYNQLLHLLFGQITGCGSLRDICLCLEAHKPILHHQAMRLCQSQSICQRTLYFEYLYLTRFYRISSILHLLRVLRLLARKLADSVMQPIALKRLEHIIKSSGDSISQTVLKDYLEYMEDAFLIFSVPNLVSPLTEQQTIKKRYFADNGILNNFLFNGDTKLLENLVAVHLNRLYHNTEEELRLFYYNKGVEVDFCVPEENLAVQVSYNIDDAETYEREVGGLVKFLKAFKSYHGTIVTWDTSSTVEEDGISVTVIPIWEWLLI